jgi:hypothetical protein
MSIRKIRIKALRLASVLLVPIGLFVGPPWPEESAIDFGMDVLGHMLLIGGPAVRVWATLHVGSRKSPELVPRRP